MQTSASWVEAALREKQLGSTETDRRRTYRARPRPTHLIRRTTNKSGPSVFLSMTTPPVTFVAGVGAIRVAMPDLFGRLGRRCVPVLRGVHVLHEGGLRVVPYREELVV